MLDSTSVKNFDFLSSLETFALLCPGNAALYACPICALARMMDSMRTPAQRVRERYQTTGVCDTAANLSMMSSQSASLSAWQSGAVTATQCGTKGAAKTNLHSPLSSPLRTRSRVALGRLPSVCELNCRSPYSDVTNRQAIMSQKLLMTRYYSEALLSVGDTGVWHRHATCRNTWSANFFCTVGCTAALVQRT